MDPTERKMTKIARELNKLTVQTMKEEGIGTAEFDFIHLVRHHPGITQAQLREELKTSILQAELERPKYSRKDIVEWISRFKYGDPNNKEYQRQIIDIFLNSIYVFDDRLVFTYNYKNGTQTVTLADVSAAFGSDLKSCTPPKRDKLVLEASLSLLLFSNRLKIELWH